MDEWQQHAVASGPPQVVDWFFQWLRKQRSGGRSKMLAFVTGSSVLPCGWQGLRDPQGVVGGNVEDVMKRKGKVMKIQWKKDENA